MIHFIKYQNSAKSSLQNISPVITRLFLEQSFSPPPTPSHLTVYASINTVDMKMELIIPVVIHLIIDYASADLACLPALITEENQTNCIWLIADIFMNDRWIPDAKNELICTSYSHAHAGQRRCPSINSDAKEWLHIPRYHWAADTAHGVEECIPAGNPGGQNSDTNGLIVAAVLFQSGSNELSALPSVSAANHTSLVTWEHKACAKPS